MASKIDKAYKHALNLVEIGYTYRKAISKIKTLYSLKQDDIDDLIINLKSYKRDKECIEISKEIIPKQPRTNRYRPGII